MAELGRPEGHGLDQGQDDDHTFPEAAEAITAGLLHAASVTVIGVDIDKLDAALTTGQRRGHPAARAAAARVHRDGHR